MLGLGTDCVSSQLQSDPMLRNRVDVGGVDEARAVSGIYDDPVEYVLLLVGKHLLDLAHLDSAGVEYGGSGRKHLVGDWPTWIALGVHSCQISAISGMACFLQADMGVHDRERQMSHLAYCRISQSHSLWRRHPSSAPVHENGSDGVQSSKSMAGEE